MEANTKWKPNENDWRSQQQPDLRKKVILHIVEKLKRLFPKHTIKQIRETAVKFEDNIYGIAKDKDDYMRKILDRILLMDKKLKNVESGSSVSNQGQAQVMNQGQPLPTSLPYTQTSTSQQWLPPQSNLNIPRSSVLPTKTQNVNSQMGERNRFQGQMQGRPQPQQKPNYMVQHQTSQQLLKDKIHHGNLQKQQPQQLPHSTIHQSFAQSTSLSPSGQQEKLITQLMDVPVTQQNHIGSSFQQNNNLQKKSQELGQSQPMMYHPPQQPLKRSVHQHLDGNKKNQPYQLQPAPPPSTSQDSRGGDWQEETYQKMKALKEMYSPILTTMHKRVVEKLRQPQQPMQNEELTQKLRGVKSTLEHVFEFFKLHKTSISEKHRDRFHLYEDQILKLTKSPSVRRRPMQHQQQQQQQQGQFQTPQVDVSRSLANNQMNLQTMIPHSKDENNLTASMGNEQQKKGFNHGQIQQPVLHMQKPQQQQQQQQQQINEINDVRMMQQQGINQQCLSTSQRQIQHQSAPSPVTSLAPFALPITERPIDRLIKELKSSSPKSLAESVYEMSTVMSMADRIAGSFHSSGRSKASLAENLSATTKIRLQEANPSNKRLKRSITALPLESEVDSTTTASKIEPSFALLQEIKEINGRLVETMVNICDDEIEGTIVTCSYFPVALCDTFKAHYNSGQLLQIQPLRLLVPADYPQSSPIVIEKIDLDANPSVHKLEDLSMRTRLRFCLCLNELSKPISLKEIAQAWNDSARAILAEYAEWYGGGTFSSKYGTWETVS